MPDFDILRTQFQDHCKQSDKNFSNVTETIKAFRKDLELIKNNHLAHLQKDITDLKVEVSNHGQDIAWLTKLQWFYITTSISGLIGIIFLIIKNI